MSRDMSSQGAQLDGLTPPSADEWIAWSGGPCPIPKNWRVDVRFRCGEANDCSLAGDWDWVHYEEPDMHDITAYRVIDGGEAVHEQVPQPIRDEPKYVLVPRDCTMEMIRAGEEEYASPSPVYDEDGDEGDWLSRTQAVWYAMLSVAPKPSPTKAPSREGVARTLAEHFGARVWDEMAADRADLRIVVRTDDRGRYDINEPTKADCFDAADAIITLFKGGEQ